MTKMSVVHSSRGQIKPPWSSTVLWHFNPTLSIVWQIYSVKAASRGKISAKLSTFRFPRWKKKVASSCLRSLTCILLRTSGCCGAVSQGDTDLICTRKLWKDSGAKSYPSILLLCHIWQADTKCQFPPIKMIISALYQRAERKRMSA